jgi:hypothetical protein
LRFVLPLSLTSFLFRFGLKERFLERYVISLKEGPEVLVVNTIMTAGETKSG